MGDFTISEENLRKAYNEGSHEIKKVFETLIPDLFKVKFPCVMINPRTGLIVYMIKESDKCKEEGCGYVLDTGKEGYQKHKYSETWYLNAFMIMKDFKIIKE